MVIDTSALICVLTKEHGWEPYLQALLDADKLSMSTATLVEANLVALRKNVGPELNALLSDLGVEIIPFTYAQTQIAAQGDAKFGKGRSKAQLNFGDLFTYALAKDLNQPLLFKGEDFAQTDVIPALSEQR